MTVTTHLKMSETEGSVMGSFEGSREFPEGKKGCTGLGCFRDTLNPKPQSRKNNLSPKP